MGRARNSSVGAVGLADQQATRFDALFGTRRSDSARPEPAPYVVLLGVAAEAHSDDYVVEVTFDAASWFAQATDIEITELIECDWGGDYPADRVAEHYREAETQPLFSYLEEHRNQKNAPGFECHVDPESARAWLAANRHASI
jgi:hypothetical protein